MSDLERGYIAFEPQGQDELYYIDGGTLDWGMVCGRCGEMHQGQGEEEMQLAFEGGYCVRRRVSLLHLVWNRLRRFSRSSPRTLPRVPL